MRVLLIEDEKDLARVIKKGLEEEGYSVDVAHDGEEGLYMAENYEADVIILDILLPVMDGLSVLREMRRSGIKTPVLLLTAKGDVSDRIKGLDTGADDYLAKPFDFGELLARIRALLRRARDVKEPIIRIGDLEVDTVSHEVRRGGKEIHLTAREYAILEYLAYNAGRVVSRTELIEHVYDESFDMDSNIIDVYIAYLRRKVDKGFGRPLIHTVRGAGYMLKERREG